MKKIILPGTLFILMFLLVAQTADAATRSSRSSRSRYSSSIQKKINKLDDDRDKRFPIPILLGVGTSSIRDTWGEARSQGRTHEGNDIFAPKGAFVVSPTEAVVTDIVKEDKDNRNTLGGNYVYTANPGGERFYYAHLDGFADDLEVGDELEPGDLIGYVGNTGNAAGGATHLHFGIYKDGATNPYDRLKEEFSLKQRMESLEKILDDAGKGEKALAQGLLLSQRALFVEAKTKKIDIPDAVNDLLKAEAKAQALVLQTLPVQRDLSIGMQGEDVRSLQGLLIAKNKGPMAVLLSNAGATGYFGPVTQNALIEYQTAQGIVPASGIFESVTRIVITQ